MNNIILSILITFFISFGFSQVFGKKQQIEKLSFQVDSLNTVIKNERKANNQKEFELNSTISKLENEVYELEVKVLKQEKEINDCLNSAENLLKDANNFQKDEELESALFVYEEIIQAYPTSEEAIIAKESIEEINKTKAQAEKDRLTEMSEMFVAKEHDPFKERTFYKDRRGDKFYSKSKFSLYFSIPDNKEKPESLRFIAGYTGSDWLFIDKVTFLIKNESKATIYGNFERDNTSQNVYEWTDVAINSSIKRIINAVSEGKSILIRFHGDTYNKDVMMNKKQTEAIINIWNLYLKMGGSI